MAKDDTRRLTLQILWSMFHRKHFMRDFEGKLDGEFFGSKEAQYLARMALDYWDEYQDIIPESGVFDRIDQDEDEEELDKYGVSATAVFKLWDNLLAVKNTEIDYVWQQTEDFAKRRVLGLALVEASSALTDDGPEAALSIIDKARVIIEPRPVKTVKVFAGMSEILERVSAKLEDSNYASTGLPKLDRYLGGGVLPGELAAFIAPTGRGKTMWLCHVAGKAFAFGMEVLYYTLEVDRDEIALRTMASLSGLSINEMKLWAQFGNDPEYAAVTKDEEGNRITPPGVKVNNMMRRIARMGGAHRDIDVIDLPQASVSTIQADIERRKREGANPRLVIIDYADRLTPRVTREKKEQEELAVFRDLVSLGKAQDVAIWTAIQGNRQSLGKRNLDLKLIAGAYAKAWEADFVIAAGQNDQMMLHNQFTIGLAKVRRVSGSAQTGSQLDVFYDFSTSQFRDIISPHDDDELLGMPLAKKVDWRPGDEDGGGKFKGE